MRRLTLLFALVFLVAAPTAVAQSPDSDGDGTPDAQDACPQQQGGNQGCPPPPDSDRDGVPDDRDACGPDGNPSPPPVDARGCPPFQVGFSIVKLAPPTVKEFLKQGWTSNVFARGPIVDGKPLIRLRATLLLNAATAKKFRLRSRTIDTFSGQSPKASEDAEGGGRYVFPKFIVSGALKKKLAKLKRFSVTIEYVLTDAYDKKHSFTGRAEIGSKNKPSPPTPNE